LLAEDNLFNAEWGRAALEHLHCQVRVARDGQAVVAEVEAEAFDLILMDRRMPNVDGLEATRVIRWIEAWDERDRTPIVAVTASVMPQEVAQCLAAGMDDVLAKPFMLNQLSDMLDKWLDTRPCRMQDD
jgi:CheY-like chemotaxis protein